MASPNKGFFQLLTEWLQSLLGSLNPLSTSSTSSTSESDSGGTASDAGTGGASSPAPSQSGATGIDRVIKGGRITARFLSTGSPAWTNQWKGVYLTINGVRVSMQGKHGGLDISAPQGSPVYAPYGMTVIKIGHYDDVDGNGDHCCRYGYYVIGMLDNDRTVQYYSGHLQNVKIRDLSHINAGTQLGETNEFNHTHLQLKRSGVLLDPEDYLARHSS